MPDSFEDEYEHLIRERRKHKPRGRRPPKPAPQLRLPPEAERNITAALSSINDQEDPT